MVKIDFIQFSPDLSNFIQFKPILSAGEDFLNIIRRLCQPCSKLYQWVAFTSHSPLPTMAPHITEVRSTYIFLRYSLSFYPRLFLSLSLFLRHPHPPPLLQILSSFLLTPHPSHLHHQEPPQPQCLHQPPESMEVQPPLRDPRPHF